MPYICDKRRKPFHIYQKSPALAGLRYIKDILFQISIENRISIMKRKALVLCRTTLYHTKSSSSPRSISIAKLNTLRNSNGFEGWQDFVRRSRRGCKASSKKPFQGISRKVYSPPSALILAALREAKCLTSATKGVSLSIYTKKALLLQDSDI